MGKIIAVSNQKGGVGKTTTSVNLAACVADAGKRVLLIDIDPQGNASSGLGQQAREGFSVYQVIIDELEAEKAIVQTDFGSLDVLPSSIELAGAEIELVAMPGRETLLREALKPVRERYDYIFIDCPPSLGLITLNALCAADGARQRADSDSVRILCAGRRRTADEYASAGQKKAESGAGH